MSNQSHEIVMPLLRQWDSWFAKTHFWHCLTIDGFAVNHGRWWSSRGGCACEAWTTFKTDLNVNLTQISAVINSVQVFRWSFFTFVIDRVRLCSWEAFQWPRTKSWCSALHWHGRPEMCGIVWQLSWQQLQLKHCSVQCSAGRPYHPDPKHRHWRRENVACSENECC